MNTKAKLSNKILILFLFVGLISFSTALINIETSGTGLRIITLSSNITNFTELQDTPGSYSGQGALCVGVNAGETALEFISCSTGAGDITDVFGDIWITNGSDSGFVTLIFNETNLNRTIDARPSPTTNIFDQDLNTTFNVVFASVNATNNLTTQRYCNATECHTIEDFLVDTGGTETDPIWTANLTDGISANLFPQTNATFNFGSTILRWLNGYFNGLSVNQLNASVIRSYDWTNVTITESQISDLTPANTTLNIFDQELNTTFNVVFASVNATNNLTTQRYCNATECHVIEDFLVDTGGATLNIFDQTVNTTSNVTFNIVNVSINITATYFIGNGSQLEGIVHTIDTNESSFVGNLTENDCANGDVMSGVQVNGTVLCVLDSGGAITNIFDQDLNTTSNVTFNLVNVSINVTATYFIGNGSQLEGIVHTVDSWIANLSTGVTATLFPLTDSVFDFGTTSLRWLTGFFDFIVVGELNATSINVTNNITATYFIGNGSQLTSIDHTATTNIAYVNNTQTFTAPLTFTSNFSVNGNISVTGNITVQDRVCFTVACDKYMFYNGTSLIIQG